MKAGYVHSEKVGKEAYFSTTPEGYALCLKYREVREECLITVLPDSGLSNQALADAAKLLRAASGLYDTASRGATSR